MRLSELQQKEIINISNGKRIGIIIDVVVDTNGNIQKLVLEEKRGRKFSKEEFEILWSQIVKVGDDIILIDTNCANMVPDSSSLSSNVIYSANGSNVDTTICNGKVLMENKKLTTLDEDEIYAKAKKAIKELKELKEAI